jgi:hypothetical protein
MSTKKFGRKSPAKGMPLKMEYSGHWIEGNIWFKLGLSKTEAKMLKAVAGKIFCKKAKSANVARVLLQGALAHFDKLAPLLIQDSDYAFQEGFVTTDCYVKSLVEQQLAKIAGGKSKSK